MIEQYQEAIDNFLWAKKWYIGKAENGLLQKKMYSWTYLLIKVSRQWCEKSKVQNTILKKKEGKKVYMWVHICVYLVYE